MTKKELSDTLGLSCVEKYFLAWIKDYFNETKLYSNSFISMWRVLQDFAGGAEYETYTEIQRVQDIAERNGLVMHGYEALPAEQAFESLKNQSHSASLTLMRTSPAFFAGVKRVPWRKDHYIYVDRDLNWLNEYPLTEGKFSQEEFMRSYGGVVCNYKFTGVGHVPKDENIYAIRCQESVRVPCLGLKSYESAVGILRITRKRMQKYYY